MLLLNYKAHTITALLSVYMLPNSNSSNLSQAKKFKVFFFINANTYAKHMPWLKFEKGIVKAYSLFTQ